MVAAVMVRASEGGVVEVVSGVSGWGLFCVGSVGLGCSVHGGVVWGLLLY